MKLDTPALPTFVFEATENLSVSAKVRWYMCTIVNLSALNFPDVIPQVYENFAERLLKTLPVEERLGAVQKVREGLIKSVGIAGAARTGTAMRTLANCMPADFQEVESPRSQEPEDVAQERGRKFWANVYARNAAFDPKATERASPDYTFIIRDLFYGRVFSYDGILNPLDTGYAMVASLYGMDCPIQQQHHMKGMIFNGATREDLEQLRNQCMSIADALEVVFRYGPSSVPNIAAVLGQQED